MIVHAVEGAFVGARGGPPLPRQGLASHRKASLAGISDRNKGCPQGAVWGTGSLCWGSLPSSSLVHTHTEDQLSGSPLSTGHCM